MSRPCRPKIEKSPILVPVSSCTRGHTPFLLFHDRSSRAQHGTALPIGYCHRNIFKWQSTVRRFCGRLHGRRWPGRGRWGRVSWTCSDCWKSLSRWDVFYNRKMSDKCRQIYASCSLLAVSYFLSDDQRTLRRNYMHRIGAEDAAKHIESLQFLKVSLRQEAGLVSTFKNALKTNADKQDKRRKWKVIKPRIPDVQLTHHHVYHHCDIKNLTIISWGNNQPFSSFEPSFTMGLPCWRPIAKNHVKVTQENGSKFLNFDVFEVEVEFQALMGCSRGRVSSFKQHWSLPEAEFWV